MVQGELFREEDSISSFGNSTIARKKNFLSRFQLVIGLDKLLVGFIGFTVIFVLTYSFGVEHGKRLMEQNLQTMFPIQVDTTIAPAVSDAAKTRASDTDQGETVLVITNHDSTKEEQTQNIDLPNPPTPTRTFISAEPALPKADAGKGKYTVQLVTYNNETFAQKEIDRLKSKGQEGFVIPSGSHFQVCVNYFDSRLKASSFLKEFPDNARYPDAYIRPVVR